MRIGAFVKTLNTTVDTVRHYEELGLIHPVRDNQQKQYSEDHVKAFQAIQELKMVGFTLDDIGLIVKLRESFGCGAPELIHEVLQQFAHRIEALNEEIVVLQGRRDSLRALVEELQTVRKQ